MSMCSTRFCLLLSVCMVGVINAKDAELVDKVIATVYAPQGPVPVFMSDMRPMLDGSPRTLDDVIMEKLLVIDGEQRLGMQISDDEVDRFLSSIEHQTGFDRSSLRTVFEDLGYTYEEGREQIRQKQMIERVIEYRVRHRQDMIIEKADVEVYYDQHPQYNEAEFTLEQGTIAKSSITKDELEALVKAGDKEKLNALVTFQEPFTLKEHEVAQEKRPLFEREAGSIISIDEEGEYFEVTRLKSKKPEYQKTLDECYDAIVEQIGRARFKQVLENFHKELRNSFIVRYHDQ